jgi:hypothetical protein
MSDPKRLFDDGADDLTKTLLRAGRTLDAEQARERKLALLGAAGAGAAAAAAAAVATPSGVKGVLHLVSATALKWLGVGLLAAAAAVGGAAFFARPSPDAADRPESTAQGSEAPPGQNHANPVVLDPNTSHLIPSSEPSETGGAPTPGDQAGGATRPKVAAPSREAPAPEAKASAQSSGAAANSQGDSLTEEVMALKRAREALAAGRPKKALTELNIYDQRFRGGRLSLEAEVLRIEALAQSGERKAAAARAASFLSAHPSSPYANRVRAIAEGSKAPASE